MPIQVELAKDAYRKAFDASGDASENRIIKAALDVLALAEANIAFGIRERTVARGLDPGELALVAAGGAGPLLSCGIAEILQLAEVIVPPRPGLLAAWGLLVASERRESALTVLRPMREIQPVDAQTYFELAFSQLSQAPPSGAQILRTAALRYMGQGFEVEVEVADPIDITKIQNDFHAAHEHEYGFSMPDAPVEWVELRVAWEIPAPLWTFPEQTADTKTQTEQVLIWEYRRSPSDDTIQPEATQATLYQRVQIPADTIIDGPAIIVETDATTYVPTGWVATATRSGYLRITNNEPSN
jgi:N-methylhydantoinase A/oxoprolinase/acetone carboxylase beta subunit